MIDFDKQIPSWTKGHKHHSNPKNSNDFKTFFEKCYVRPKKSKAYSIVQQEILGDMEWAKQFIEKTKTRNPNMESGTIVQSYCDQVLLEDLTEKEAFRNAVSKIHSYKPLYWHNNDQENAVMEHRLKVQYTKVNEERYKREEGGGELCELEMVCANALQGVRLAAQGLNRITGEDNTFRTLPGCKLPYNGKPDYSGRIELKTKWDSSAYTDSPKVNSLPAKPTQPHMAQIAGYYFLTEKKYLPTIVYANRNAYKIFRPEEEELEDMLQQITTDCKRREGLLQKASTVEELLKMTDPDFGHRYLWNDMHPDILELAKKYAGF